MGSLLALPSYHMLTAAGAKPACFLCTVGISAFLALHSCMPHCDGISVSRDERLWLRAASLWKPDA